MRCPSCSADNAATRRFCAKCGAPLPSPCPACGFENEFDAQFCGGVRRHRCEVEGVQLGELEQRPPRLASRSRHRTAHQAHSRTRRPGKATAGALCTLRKSASSPRYRPNSLGSALGAPLTGTDPPQPYLKGAGLRSRGLRASQPLGVSRPVILGSDREARPCAKCGTRAAE